jgi:hypothetical protein
VKIADADDEHPPPPEAVAERRAGEQEDRERERVGVDRPLEASSEAPRSARMLGSAVVTTRLSSVTMKMATRAMARVTIERRDMRRPPACE